MKKQTNKILNAILGVAALSCIGVGLGFTETKAPTSASAETVASTKWTAAYTAGVTMNEDTETGMTLLSGLNAWGKRVYYNDKLTLDGLTITIGSTNMVAYSRFGFGFPKTQDGYSPRNNEGVGDGVFNVTLVPSQYTGQDCVYINSTHADGTIVYTADTFEAGVCRVDGNIVDRFISAPSTQTQYSISFEYMGEFTLNPSLGDYWRATIVLDKGNTFRAGLTSATIAFLGSSLDGVLDENGQCYLSAWGLDNTVDFYMGVKTAEEKALLEAADSALATYKTARTSDASIVNARSAAVEAIQGLPQKYQAEYQAKLAAIDAIDTNWTVAYNTCEAATYDVSTGYSTLTPNAFGDRIYYKNKVQLNGLQLLFGAYSQTSKARYGFGLISPDQDYTKFTISEIATLNIYAFYEVYEAGRTDLFVYDSADLINGVGTETTAAYIDSGLTTKGMYVLDGAVSNSLVTGQSSSGINAYTMTFHKVSDTVWSITIDVITGNGWNGVNSATMYISSSVLANAIDSNGFCYISAWGMDNAAPFCMEVKEASLQESVSNVEAAKEAYKTAIITGEGVEDAKAAYLSAVEQLPANESVKYAVDFEDLQIQETQLKNLDHSASVTVKDSLSLNYKVNIPEICAAERVTLTSEMRGKTLEYTNADAVIDAEGRYVFKAQEVTPQYMSENITLNVKAYNASGECTLSREIVYSVKQYCEQLLAATSDAALRTALVDMLNYGAEAQAYVNNTNTAANAGIDSYQLLATAFDANGATNVLAANQGDKVTFKSVTLSLEDKVSVYARFTSTADAKALSATAQIGDNSAVAARIETGANDTYYAVCDNIAPTQYAENIILTVLVNGAENAKCRYSVNSYVSQKYNDASCGELVKALYAYGVGVSKYVASLNGTGEINAVQDVFFMNGLSAAGSDNENPGWTTVSTVNANATPSWMMAQWNSKGDLRANEPYVDDGVYTYEDHAKTLELNTRTGGVYMIIDGCQEYVNGDRQNVSDPWPHLLLQQDYYEEQLVNLSQTSSFKMQMTYTVTHCDDQMAGLADPDNLHCAQFVWYITLQNRTEGHGDFGQYMWFGMILYDNREEGQDFTTTKKADDDASDSTGMTIWQMASKDWSSTKKMPKVEETITVNLDILAEAKEAFDWAKKYSAIFKSSNWEDIYVGSMNFGIELPGTYGIGIQIDNVGLIYTK